MSDHKLLSLKLYSVSAENRFFPEWKLYNKTKVLNRAKVKKLAVKLVKIYRRKPLPFFSPEEPKERTYLVLFFDFYDSTG